MLVKPRPITKDERHLAIAFQEALKLLVDFSKIKYPTLNEYQSFRSNIIKYSNLPFFEKIKNRISQIDKKLSSIELAKSIDPSNMFLMIQKSEQALRAGNYEAFLQYAKNLNVDAQENRWFNPTNIIGKWKYHAWHKQNPLFFGTTGIIEQFDVEEQEKILNFNLKQPLWTYITIPDSKLHDYEYIIWWILHLRTSPKNVNIDDEEFKIYAEFAFAGPKFEQLKILISQYLQSNSKQLLPEILNLIMDIPEIAKMNAKKRKETTTVYRGIPINEKISNKDIIAQDYKQHYIATSKRYNVAKNFAMKIGHLESEEARRSEHGVIITYSVNPTSILFDTSILGGIYNESEIIINSHKAKVSDINYV